MAVYLVQQETHKYSHTKKLKESVSQKFTHDCELNQKDKCTPYRYGMYILGQDMEHLKCKAGNS